MTLKALLSLALVLFAVAVAPIGAAQDRPPQIAEATPNPDVESLAKALIEEALQVSHAADIYADLRRTLREVYIPAVRDFVQGDFPGLPAPDAKTAAAMAKVLTLMDYARKAGDDLDAAFAENRAAMISDTAAEIAKSAQAPEIQDVRDVLQLPAVRKTLDAFYAMTKLVTGFTYDDTRSLSKFSAWANGLDLDVSQGVPGMPKAAPSKSKIAKAQALMNDLIQISHLDDVVADIKRFVRDVYAETAPMSDEDRQQLREQADQMEFTYTMQKAMAVSVAPSVVAAALSDEQLATLHGFVRSPAFAKAFDLFRDVVKTSTAFTKDDILGAQNSFEKLDRKSKLRERSPEEQDKAKAEWNALTKKWTETLKNRISPETRMGLQQALDDLQTSETPI